MEFNLSELTNLKPASEHLEFNIAIIPQERLKASVWTGAFVTVFISPYISATCQHTRVNVRFFFFKAEGRDVTGVDSVIKEVKVKEQ